MAIETRTINGTLTEAYTSVEGSYMTQAKATHFHDFWTRKILTSSESTSDFREVTASEKAKLEAADAAWERPPQSFIDAWNARADFSANGRYPQYVFGKYNEETGYFELNTLLDIDYAEAQEIMALSGRKTRTAQSAAFINLRPTFVRTLMPINYAPLNTSPMIEDYESTLQVIRFFSSVYPLIFWDAGQMFQGTVAVHTILCNLGCRRTKLKIGDAPKLVNINVYGYSRLFTEGSAADVSSLDISHSPLLSLESINFFIENTKIPYILLLHADAYARVTNEMFEKAAAKNITITSA